MRISVYLKAQDHLAEVPRHECSRDIAFLVICAQFAHRIGQNAIQLTTIDPWKVVKDAVLRRSGWYIPENLPPVEVPGVWFEEPDSDTWRLQHRNVSFITQSL